MSPPPAAIADSPPPPARPSLLRRFVRRVTRLIVGTLALAMVVQLVLVFTPIPERIYGWLNVTELRPERADFIVSLGGRHERLVWTSYAYNHGLGQRVIVSNAPGAAQFMRELSANCGVPRDRIDVDDKSLKTYQHPEGVAAIRGVDRKTKRFLIVTDVEHSRRAQMVFRKAGYEHFSIYAGPMQMAGPDKPGGWKWRIFMLPRITYEVSAMVQYWWQGKI